MHNMKHVKTTIFLNVSYIQNLLVCIYKCTGPRCHNQEYHVFCRYL